MIANAMDTDMGNASIIVENDDGENEHFITIPIRRNSITQYDQIVGAFMIKFTEYITAGTACVYLTGVTARKTSESTVNAFIRNSYDLMINITPVKIK